MIAVDPLHRDGPGGRAGFHGNVRVDRRDVGVFHFLAEKEDLNPGFSLKNGDPDFPGRRALAQIQP